jgi:hypothetical protein
LNFKLKGIRYFVNFITVLILMFIMWSEKTPLKLPGKRSDDSIKYEVTNSEIFSYSSDDDELTTFSRQFDQANKINNSLLNNNNNNNYEMK